MDLKKINKLTTASYRGDLLNQKKVNKIASVIGKSDLKRYINALKTMEKKKTLVVSAPVNNQDLKKFEKLFPNKKIIFNKNPSLMLGVNIVDNDISYEFSLKNSLERIISYIEQNYD